MRLQPPTGHIPLISSRREYLLSKVRGGGRPRATPSRPRTPSPSPTRNAETLRRLGEGAEGSGAGGGGASRGCGDAAVAAAMEAAAAAAAAEMEAAEMEEEARPSSTGATKAAFLADNATSEAGKQEQSNDKFIPIVAFVLAFVLTLLKERHPL